ncbi:MAG: exosome complex protein Rrp4 [DPANN group archaeon]|nr:exosome complex protein Rrp4 [DPANN group archaeon]
MAKLSVKITKKDDKKSVVGTASKSKTVVSKKTEVVEANKAVTKNKLNVIVTVKENNNPVRIVKNVQTVKKTDTRREVEETVIVVPGDLLEDNLNVLAGLGTYRDGSKVYSKYTGLLKKRDHMITVIPLNGVYVPKKGDFVIGEIKSSNFSNWWVDIGTAFNAKLPVMAVPEFIERNADLSKFYKNGDLVFARVDSVTSDPVIPLFMKDRMCRKLYHGRVIDIIPTKVPRLIGREGTMIHLIKDSCKSVINVGQNGRVWVKGGDESLAERAIKMVEMFAYKSGLTDMVSDFLESELKNNKSKVSVSENTKS